MNLTDEQVQRQFESFFEDDDALWEWADETVIFDAIQATPGLREQLIKAIRSTPMSMKRWNEECSERAESMRENPGE